MAKTETRKVDTGIVQRGSTYRFTVYMGYDMNGKQIRKTTTFVPPAGLTLKKADKLAKEEYINFCNRCKGLYNLKENMKFSELVEEYFRLYAPNNLKPITAYNYQKHIDYHFMEYFGNKKLKDLLLWIAIIFIGAVFYNNKYLFNNFIPYISTNVEKGVLQIKKSNDGHFYITLEINNKNVLFLIDTGATTISLTERDAKRIGIDTNKLKYNKIVNTANGVVYNATIKLDKVTVNDYIVKDLWVDINKNMSGVSLLGMNFLNKLEGYDIRKDIMTLYFVVNN